MLIKVAGQEIRRYFAFICTNYKTILSSAKLKSRSLIFKINNITLKNWILIFFSYKTSVES